MRKTTRKRQPAAPQRLIQNPNPAPSAPETVGNAGAATAAVQTQEPEVYEIPKIDVQAETIVEARILPEDEDIDALYNRVYAARDLHYVKVNPASTICDRRNPCDVSFYMRMGYRRVDQQPTKEKIVRLIYPKGHPDCPNGGEHDYPHPYVMMACTQVHYKRIMEQENRRTRMNNDVERHMDSMKVLSKQGQLVEDHTLGEFTISVGEGFNAGKNVESASALRARDQSIERGYQKMEELGISQAIEQAVESSLAE